MKIFKAFFNLFRFRVVKVEKKVLDPELMALKLDTKNGTWEEVVKALVDEALVKVESSKDISKEFDQLHKKLQGVVEYIDKPIDYHFVEWFLHRAAVKCGGFFRVSDVGKYYDFNKKKVGKCYICNGNLVGCRELERIVNVMIKEYILHCKPNVSVASFHHITGYYREFKGISLVYIFGLDDDDKIYLSSDFKYLVEDTRKDTNFDENKKEPSN